MEKYELVRLESKSVALALSDAPVAHRSHTNTKSKWATLRETLTRHDPLAHQLLPGPPLLELQLQHCMVAKGEDR